MDYVAHNPVGRAVDRGGVVNPARLRKHLPQFKVRAKYYRTNGGGVRCVKVWYYVQGVNTLQGKRGGWKLWGVFSLEEWEKRKNYVK